MDRPVVHSPHVVRLPTGTALSDAHSFVLAENRAGQVDFINWQQDPFGNYLACIAFRNRSQTFG